MEFHEFGMDYLKKALPAVVEREMNIKIRTMKFIGGGSYGKVFKTETEDGKIFALKAYRRKGLNEREAFQLKALSENTDVPMPQVLSSYSDDNVSFLAMSFIEGQNVLSPVYMLFGKKKKQAFAESVVKGMLQWHSVKGEKFGDLENPSYDSWYDFYDLIAEGIVMPLGALSLSVLIGWVWKTEIIKNECELSGNRFIGYRYYNFCFKFVVPIILSLIFYAQLLDFFG